MCLSSSTTHVSSGSLPALQVYHVAQHVFVLVAHHDGPLAVVINLLSVKEPVMPQARHGRVSSNRVSLGQGKDTGTGICSKGSGYSRLLSRHTDSPRPCRTLRHAIPSGSPVVLWGPVPHPPREDLFLTTPDVWLACVSWVVACQLPETSGSAVPVACFLCGQGHVSA